MSDERIKRLERHVEFWLNMLVGVLIIAVVILYVIVGKSGEQPSIERPQTPITTEEE